MLTKSAFPNNISYIRYFLILCPNKNNIQEEYLTMLFEQIRDIICKQLEINENDVTMDTNIRDDLGADSLDLVDLAISLEDEFEVEVPDNVIEKFETVGDIVRFIEEL